MLKRIFSFDLVIFALVLLLLFFSLFILKSVSPSLFWQQLLWSFLGLILFIVFSQIDCRLYQRFYWFFYFGAIFFLLLTILFGTLSRGSVRWLEIGAFRFQPSEFVKPFLILFFASFLTEAGKDNLKRIIQSGALMILAALLIFFQPDLGSSLVIVFIWIVMVLAKGINGRWFLSGSALTLVVLPLIWLFLKDYQKQRIFTFLNPSSDPLGKGFNLIQAIIAVGSGKFFGRGLGRGTQSHLQFLPERQTDFIFASLAEELGFFGALILIIIFFILLLRLILTAFNQNDRFTYLVIMGVFGLIFIQVFVNIGMNIGLLPITGITLPLVSYGGSSLISIMIALGFVANITKIKRREKAVEIK